MKILVIGGMHGNEPLGIKLVQMFKKNQIKNVDVVFGNEKAIKANCRFIKQDLNRSFPGNSKGKSYEEKRASFLIDICKRYDLVFDFHNTHCPNNDCSFVGVSANKNLINTSAFLGLRRIIIADYDCINKYASNCISIEISLGSKNMNSLLWYKRIKELSMLKLIPNKKNVNKYRFVYRMTLEDKKRFNLEEENFKAFKQISRGLAESIGVKSPAYPIFIGDKYTPYNYGGILNKLKRRPHSTR